MRLLKIYIRFFFLFAVSGIVSLLTSSSLVFAAQEDPVKGRVLVSVHETTRVIGSDVLLGNVADIWASKFLKEELTGLVVGSSPDPDEVKVFDRKKIVSLLNRQKYLPRNIEVISPERIYVKRISQPAPKDKIVKYVEQLLEQESALDEYKLTSFDIRGLKPLPEGTLTLKADKTDILGSKGNFSFSLELFVDGCRAGKVRVSGSTAVYKNVLYISQNMKRGDCLARSDLYYEKKNIFELNGNYITELESAENMILKTGINKGTLLKKNHIREPFLIKKGDVVTLVARDNNLTIVTSGLCRENGFADNLVKVENISSGKLVRGLVKGKSRVEVVY